MELALHVKCQARLRKRLHNSGKDFPVWPTNAFGTADANAANKTLSVESAFGRSLARIAAFESLSAFAGQPSQPRRSLQGGSNV
jgi:hypothetical protein